MICFLTIDGAVTNHFCNLTLPSDPLLVSFQSTGSNRGARLVRLRTLPRHEKEIIDHIRLRPLQRA